MSCPACKSRWLGELRMEPVRTWGYPRVCRRQWHHWRRCELVERPSRAVRVVHRACWRRRWSPSLLCSMLWSAGEPRCTRQPSDHPSGDPMRLTIRLLVLVGTPLLAIGVAYLLLLGAFACYDGCSASQKAAAVAERVTGVAPFTILSAVPVTVAWILCLVQLVRTRRRGVAVALALA